MGGTNIIEKHYNSFIWGTQFPLLATFRYYITMASKVVYFVSILGACRLAECVYINCFRLRLPDRTTTTEPTSNMSNDLATGLEMVGAAHTVWSIQLLVYLGVTKSFKQRSSSSSGDLTLRTSHSFHPLISAFFFSQIETRDVG